MMGGLHKNFHLGDNESGFQSVPPGTWHDYSSSKRCEWVDQLRGWAAIVMIEVHVVNAFLRSGMIPDWLNFVNGLVAPSFIMCAGFSASISTFKSDGSLRSFLPSAKRLGIILLWAYLLHFPGFTFFEWTERCTLQKMREICKIDVLQCIVFSLLILHGLARAVRKPIVFAFSAIILAFIVAFVSPYLWRPGVCDGLWLPIRGLLNGNADRGVQALFPLFPWFSFAAFGSVLGVFYQKFRICNDGNSRSNCSEIQWIFAMALLGALLFLWGSIYAKSWLIGVYPDYEIWRYKSTTLPSVAQRVGNVCLVGALLGWIELKRRKFKFINIIDVASRESLLIYIFHLLFIFRFLLDEKLKKITGMEWHTLGWNATICLSIGIILLNLVFAVMIHRIKENPEKYQQMKLVGVMLAALLFFKWESFLWWLLNVVK